MELRGQLVNKASTIVFALLSHAPATVKDRMYLKTLTAIAATLLSLPACATDARSASLEFGASSKVRMLRLQLQSHWDQRWLRSNGMHVGGYWDGGLAQWRGKASRNVLGQYQHISNLNFTPMFRLQSDTLRGWYGEGGIGINLLSKRYDNNDDFLSTVFQFNDRLGVGYVNRQGWDVGIRAEHFSNGGIKRPNSGVNFLVLRVARQF